MIESDAQCRNLLRLIGKFKGAEAGVEEAGEGHA